MFVDHIKYQGDSAEDKWSGRITILACFFFFQTRWFHLITTEENMTKNFHRDTKIWFEFEVQRLLGLICSSIISSSNSVRVDSVDEWLGPITRVAGVCFVRLNSFTYHQRRKQDENILSIPRDTECFETEVQLLLGIMRLSIISSSNFVKVDSVDEWLGRIRIVAYVCFVRLIDIIYHRRKEDPGCSKQSMVFTGLIISYFRNMIFRVCRTRAPGRGIGGNICFSWEPVRHVLAHSAAHPLQRSVVFDGPR